MPTQYNKDGTGIITIDDFRGQHIGAGGWIPYDHCTVSSRNIINLNGFLVKALYGQHVSPILTATASYLDRLFLGYSTANAAGRRIYQIIASAGVTFGTSATGGMWYTDDEFTNAPIGYVTG